MRLVAGNKTPAYDKITAFYYNLILYPESSSTTDPTIRRLHCLLRNREMSTVPSHRVVYIIVMMIICAIAYEKEHKVNDRFQVL